jgi:hypothetical protein
MEHFDLDRAAPFALIIVHKHEIDSVTGFETKLARDSYANGIRYAFLELVEEGRGAFGASEKIVLIYGEITKDSETYHQHYSEGVHPREDYGPPFSYQTLQKELADAPVWANGSARIYKGGFDIPGSEQA